MRGLLLSDLHLEYASMPADAGGADFVVLAGDIAIGTAGVEWAKAFGVPTFYVPGNHEFDDGALGLIEDMRRVADGSHVRILDDEVALHGHVRIIGSTLWSDFALFGGNVDADDHRPVDDQAFDNYELTKPALLARHRRSVRYIQEMLEVPFSGQTLVATHFAPSARSIPERFAEDPRSAFLASNLDMLVRDSGAVIWHHGHVHDTRMYFIGETKVIANPRGTPGEDCNPAFDPRFMIDI